MTTSYLFMSKNKRLNNYIRKMDKQSSSDSNISLDSLEADFKQKAKMRNEKTPDNVDTILVPFYQKDVLIKIPKGQSKKQKKDATKSKKDHQNTSSYLVNKDKDSKKKRASYLEMFRKQFTTAQSEKTKPEQELRSLSPECGDTERESFDEDINNPNSEFYNTECYNEMFYNKLLNQELEQYLGNSFTEELQMDDINNKSPEGSVNVLKSVSEVSHSRRHVRRATVEPVQSVKLGGLGPDVEKIKPRLERARSLQRYSEKVRMENRLRIYKKSVQADIEKRPERNLSAKPVSSARIKSKGDENISYLVNKNSTEKSKVATIYDPKSAGASRTRDKSKEEIKKRSASRNIEQDKQRKKSGYQDRRNDTKPTEVKAPDSGKIKSKSVENNIKVRVKSSARSKAINTDVVQTVPPVHISFLVNVGGARPTSALKKLEEKHQMYKEQVKAFGMEKTD
ncbi:uncharacterized protein LOC128673014 [Plodia interpunctella]|uniref:uncharacterized protein LOC128673014 n=1 Tax=Plodia interpunctella TaxID=58824 RepID=UPI0023687A54|nr:uncharacterized protein LOC128673014 [Plodia interpunctella]